MPFTGNKVIEAARGLDPSFSGTNHPSRVCLEFLTRYQRRLAGKMLQVEKESISSEISISLPLADFAAGAELVDALGDPLQYDRLHGFAFEDGNGQRFSLPVVPFKARMNSDRTVYGWLREGVLFLVGTAQDYARYTAIIVTYAPTASTPVELGEELILPDSAFDTVVLALGAEMGRRRPDLVYRKTIASEAVEAEKDYLNLIEERNDTEVGIVRRVFSL